MCRIPIGHLARMYESADARRILTTVPQMRVTGKDRQDVLTPLDWPQ